MTEKDQDIRERYIYQVIRRMPKNQREEIRMELKELISDMCEHDTMEEVLVKLGEPEVFARKYRDGNEYIIGPKYYYDYIWVLKIVLACVLLSGIISSVINPLIELDWSTGGRNTVVSLIVDIMIEFSGNIIISGIGAFGAVTLVFAFLEHQNVKVDLKQKEAWSPEKLPSVPDKKVEISRGKSVAGIVFTVFFGAIFLFAPEVIGAYVMEEGQLIKTIPIFNLEKWNVILPFLMAGFGIYFVDEMIRLVTGCYCKVVMVSNIVAGILQMALSIVIIKVLPFWNVNFAKETSIAFDREFTSKGDLMHYWGTGVVSNIFLAVIFIAIMIEVSVTIYKTLRYCTN